MVSPGNTECDIDNCDIHVTFILVRVIMKSDNTRHRTQM